QIKMQILYHQSNRLSAERKHRARVKAGQRPKPRRLRIRELRGTSGLPFPFQRSDAEKLADARAIHRVKHLYAASSTVTPRKLQEGCARSPRASRRGVSYSWLTSFRAGPRRARRHD